MGVLKEISGIINLPSKYLGGIISPSSKRYTKAQRNAFKKRKLKSAIKLVKKNGKVVMSKRALKKARTNAVKFGKKSKHCSRPSTPRGYNPRVKSKGYKIIWT